MSAPETEAPGAEGMQTLEDMSKEGLISMFHKVRAQTLQLAKDKKQVEELLEASTKGMDEIRNRALVVIQRCKELEGIKSKYEESERIIEEQNQRLQRYAANMRMNNMNNVDAAEEDINAGKYEEHPQSMPPVFGEQDLAMQTLVKYLESELVKKENVITELHNELSAKGEQCATQQVQLEGMKSKHNEVNQRLLSKLGELNSQLQAKCDEHATEAAGSVACQQRLADREGQVAKHQADVESKQVEITALEAKVNSLQQSAGPESTALRERLAELEVRVAQHSVQRAAHADGSASHAGGLAAVTVERNELAVALERKEAVYATLLKSNAVLRNDAEALKQALEVAQEQSRECSGMAVTKIKLLSEKLDVSGKELESANTRIAELAAHCEEAFVVAAQASREKVTQDERVAYFTSKVESMAELEGKLREKIRSLKAQRTEMQADLARSLAEQVTLRASVEQYEVQLSNLTIQLSSNDANGETAQNQLLIAVAEAAQLRKQNDAFQKALKPPREFEVLLRCSDGTQNWCLISSQAEGRLDQWFTEAQVVRDLGSRSEQSQGRDGVDGAANAFSIEGGDIELPPVLQEELRATFQREKVALLAQIEALAAETAQSQQAFDTYRERAKQSLLKSVADQRTAEDKITGFCSQLQALTSENAQLLLQADSAEQRLLREVAAVQAELTQGRLLCAQLKISLEKARLDIDRLTEAEGQLRSALQRAEESKLQQESPADWQIMVAELESALEDKVAREKQLVGDLKKKGNIARQLLLAKDEELSILRDKLRIAVETANGLQFAAAAAPKLVSAHPVTEHSAAGTNTTTTDDAQIRHKDKSLIHTSSDMSVFSAEELQSVEAMSTAQGADAGASDSNGSVAVDMSSNMGELFRRAVARETELLDRVRVLRGEVQLLRSRHSVLGPSAATSAPTGIPRGALAETDLVAAAGSATSTDIGFRQDGEREQRLLYLRQAFCGFFRTKQGVEMQNLARVMCAILGVDDAEQSTIMESIAQFAPALVASTTFESLSYNFSSLFT